MDGDAIVNAIWEAAEARRRPSSVSPDAHGGAVVKNSATLEIGGVQFGPTLMLERIPLYLRFVTANKDWATLDALDLLDDEPKAGESIIVAKCVKQGRVHVDRVVNGRRVGEWFTQAVYAPVDQQPDQNEVDLTHAWERWVTEHHAKSKTEQAK